MRAHNLSGSRLGPSHTHFNRGGGERTPQSVDVAQELIKLLPESTLSKIRAANAYDAELYAHAEQLFVVRLQQYGLA
jgi:hypothetical protein